MYSVLYVYLKYAVRKENAEKTLSYVGGDVLITERRNRVTTCIHTRARSRLMNVISSRRWHYTYCVLPRCLSIRSINPSLWERANGRADLVLCVFVCVHNINTPWTNRTVHCDKGCLDEELAYACAIRPASHHQHPILCTTKHLSHYWTFYSSPTHSHSLSFSLYSFPIPLLLKIFNWNLCKRKKHLLT